jgi:DNA-binding response OmpR family regulator
MPIRVLMLDDDADLLDMLQEALKSDGFDVETCRTVQNATALLERSPFDVVVTDLALERTGGLAFCERVSKLPAAPPVLVLTGYDEASAAALRLGARKVLVKPILIEDLKRVLREVARAAG